MAPPKCFFKRPEEFYSSGASFLHAPKRECCSPVNNSQSEELIIKTESMSYGAKNDFSQLSPLDCTNDTIDAPLDLSCKCIETDSSDLLKKLSSFLMQHQQQLARVNQTLASNHYVNLERLFCQLPPQFYQMPTAQQKPNPRVFITPPLIKSDPSLDMQSRPTDTSLLSVENRLNHLSPQSVSDSIIDNSSSETSSHSKNRTNKRKVEGKVLRPFKLYKGIDSQGLMESLGINEEDEEWLKSIVEYKSVDDVFLFLTSCMNEDTKPLDLSDEIIENIKTKFGHIFQNCNTTISNPRMVRHPDMTPRELKTDEYWEKRRKNNDAAKRSREARRHKEDSLNQHCEKLQSENDCIRKEIERVKIRIDEIKRNIC